MKIACAFIEARNLSTAPVILKGNTQRLVQVTNPMAHVLESLKLSLAGAAWLQHHRQVTCVCSRRRVIQLARANTVLNFPIAGLVIFLWLFPVLVATTNVRAQGISDFAGLWDDWARQKNMTGNWSGLRDKLDDFGVAVEAELSADTMGNVSGGIRRRFEYAGGIYLGLNYDLEKLSDLHGLEFEVSMVYGSGQDLSTDIGTELTIAQAFQGNALGAGSVWLYRLSLQQSLLDDRLNILAGRIGAGDDFLSSNLYGNFVSGAINQNPVALGINLPSFSTYPVSTWGLRIRFKPVEEWYIMGGVYYADPEAVLDSKHGLDFSIRRSQGAMTILQIGYRFNQKKDSSGLPGNYYIGSYYNSRPFEDVVNAAHVRHGNYGVYFYGDQMVYREGGKNSMQGLTTFLTGVFAPFTAFNTFPYYGMAGWLYQGLIPGRDEDTTSLGLAYGQFSNRLSQTYEMMFELTHNFQVTPWLSVQPDFQYILRPGGTGNISDAVVLGWQTQVNF